MGSQRCAYGPGFQLGDLLSQWPEQSDIALSRSGEIEIDARGATSMPGVFAAGDATTIPFKQIIISMGSGATAALGAFDYLIRTPEPQQA